MGSLFSFTDMVTSSNKKMSREKKVVLIVVVCILMVVAFLCNTVFSTALQLGIRWMIALVWGISIVIFEKPRK